MTVRKTPSNGIKTSKNKATNNGTGSKKQGERSVRFKHGIKISPDFEDEAGNTVKKSGRASRSNEHNALMSNLFASKILAGLKKVGRAIYGAGAQIWSTAESIDGLLWRALKRFWHYVYSGVKLLTDWIIDGSTAFVRWLPTPAGLAYCAFFSIIAIIAVLWVSNSIHLVSVDLKSAQERLLNDVAREKAGKMNPNPFSVDPVVARIDGHYLRLSEIEVAARNAGTIGKDETLSLETQFTRELIESFIDQHILVKAAHDAGLTRDPAILSRMSAGQDRLLAASYVEKIVDAQITQEQLRTFYESQADIATLGEELRGRHILVKTRAEALRILAVIDKGADFASLAKRRSIDRGTAPHGGDTGYITRDMVSEKFAKNAFSYEPGSITPPFQTDDGWNLVQILERRNTDSISFDDIKDDLKEFLASRTITRKIAELKKEHEVVIYEDGFIQEESELSLNDVN